MIEAERNMKGKLEDEDEVRSSIFSGVKNGQTPSIMREEFE